jgi:integrase
MFYWDDRAKMLPSARTMKYHLSLWQQWWSGRSVDEMTSHEQKRFRLSLGEGRLKPSTIDKITATGRSALIHAVKHGILESAPHIFSIETPQEKEARPPLGRPLNVEDMAAFFDAITQPHLMVFTLILANTLTRPVAALELRRSQYDHIRNVVDLNPAGRVQTKKRRPVIPVTPTLKPWLDTRISDSDTYVAYNGTGISAFRGTWVNAVKRAGLDTGVTPYHSDTAWRGCCACGVFIWMISVPSWDTAIKAHERPHGYTRRTIPTNSVTLPLQLRKSWRRYESF